MGNGITFKITPAGKETALHNFANNGDGANPANVLVRGTGLFYGTTNDYAAETIYKVTSAGALTTLHTFSVADGQVGGQLFLGSDGNIYGGMNQGGTFGFGTAFKMTPKGVLTVLHNFNGTDGNQPAPGMVEITLGKFYGTTELGGTSGDGVVYSLTSSGTFSVLRSFSSSTDGHQALTLTLATDGNAYGVAVSGGSANCGTCVLSKVWTTLNAPAAVTLKIMDATRRAATSPREPTASSMESPPTAGLTAAASSSA